MCSTFLKIQKGSEEGRYEKVILIFHGVVNLSPLSLKEGADNTNLMYPRQHMQNMQRWQQGVRAKGETS